MSIHILIFWIGGTEKYMTTLTETTIIEDFDTVEIIKIVIQDKLEIPNDGLYLLETIQRMRYLQK